MPKSRCRPQPATYLEYALFELVAVLGLVWGVGLLTDSFAAAAAAGVAGVLAGAGLTIRLGLHHEADNVRVVNLLRSHRVPLASLSGWRFAGLSLSPAKGGCLQLISDTGDVVTARAMREEAIPWLEALGVGRLSGREFRKARRQSP